LKLTEALEPGLGHVGWRTCSAEALDSRVAVLQASGAGVGWLDTSTGHGPAYRCHAPEGHVNELSWEIEYFNTPESERTPLINRPQRRPISGVPVRRIDHVNFMCRDVTATSLRLPATAPQISKGVLRSEQQLFSSQHAPATHQAAHLLRAMANPRARQGGDLRVHRRLVEPSPPALHIAQETLRSSRKSGDLGRTRRRMSAPHSASASPGSSDQKTERERFELSKDRKALTGFRDR